MSSGRLLSDRDPPSWTNQAITPIRLNQSILEPTPLLGFKWGEGGEGWCWEAVARGLAWAEGFLLGNRGSPQLPHFAEVRFLP